MRGGVGDGLRQPVADDDPLVGEVDGGAEQLVPVGPAVFGVNGFEHADDAGDADGPAAGAGVGQGFGAVGVADPPQVVLGGGHRCGLAAVVRLHLSGLGVVVEQEGSAADAGRLRFDESEHHLGADQGVGRGAALAQDLAGHLGGERVGGRHREGGGAHRGHAAAVAGGDLGVRRDVAVAGSRWGPGDRGAVGGGRAGRRAGGVLRVGGLVGRGRARAEERDRQGGGEEGAGTGAESHGRGHSPTVSGRVGARGGSGTIRPAALDTGTCRGARFIQLDG